MLIYPVGKRNFSLFLKSFENTVHEKCTKIASAFTRCDNFSFSQAHCKKEKYTSRKVLKTCEVHYLN